MRTEPPPSVPSARGAMPSATAAAAPPLEPPGVREVSHGLRVMPVSGPSVTPFQPSSGVVVLPTITPPCSRTRATEGESSGHGPRGSIARDPRRVGWPRVSRTSLTETGTPSSSPRGSPRRQRSSDSRAAASASSAVTRQKALTAGSASSMRASTASVASTGERIPVRKPSSISLAVRCAAVGHQVPLVYVSQRACRRRCAARVRRGTGRGCRRTARPAGRASRRRRRTCAGRR